QNQFFHKTFPNGNELLRHGGISAGISGGAGSRAVSGVVKTFITAAALALIV
ncbi:MAG: hypothetical protein QOD03_435, partial [Verrucomicrobiota bacterium]